jgi:hypothetical protein
MVQAVYACMNALLHVPHFLALQELRHNMSSWHCDNNRKTNKGGDGNLVIYACLQYVNLLDPPMAEQMHGLGIVHNAQQSD